ncbi:MAG: RNA polymerase ECF-type sigma factor [Alphaproteobacteria bacterium]|nr:MAG: RNA polymerase ECF-type sigma factor [Alphaproteobacteria bacterium]
MNWRRDIDQWFIDEVLPHAADFRAYARRLCRDQTEAEDVVQEAYSKTFAVEDFRRIEDARSFVLRVVHNVVAYKVRRAKIVSIEHIPDLDASSIVDPMPDPFAHTAARQELALVEAAIRALPRQCRQVVTLRKIYEMPPAEIAVRLKISVSTVEKHLNKGMRLIAQAIFDRPPLALKDKRPAWGRKSIPKDGA